jgi:hypothetical protein
MNCNNDWTLPEVMAVERNLVCCACGIGTGIGCDSRASLTLCLGLINIKPWKSLL